MLPAFAGMISTLRFNTERLELTAAAGHSRCHRPGRAGWCASGTPFREAHETVGHLVVWCQVHDCELAEVSDDDLPEKVSPLLTPDVRDVLTVAGAIAARSGRGGTAPGRVAEQLARLQQNVHDQAAWAAT